MRHRSLGVLAAASLAFLIGAPGCKEESSGPTCITFELLEGRARTPSNVMLFFGVRTCDGEPYPGLTADDFVIFEDDQEVSAFESGQSILPQSMGFDQFSVLLLDMSGSMIQSGNLPELLSAAEGFLDRVAGTQEVAIYLFDGREELVEVSPFSADVEALKAAVGALSDYQVVDPSTNLNGALLAGLSVLDTRDTTSTAPITAGTLVLFTDGTDQAGRVSDADAESAAVSTVHAVFTIGLGGEIDRPHLQAMGKDGFEYASDSGQVAQAFTRIGERIERESQRFYILGYCSPKRAGTHSLRLEVRGADGSLTYQFDANGFEAGCDSEQIANPCKNRQCGTLDGFDCGSCAGATEYCDVGGQCVDDCAGRVCGPSPMEGYDCGTCTEQGEGCDASGQCVAGCTGIECGPGDLGVDCGTCAGSTEYCDVGGQCVDDCAGRVCGPSPVEGYDCGTCGGATSFCNTAGQCVADPAGLTWITLSGGTYQMGSTTGYSDEQPVHQVTVPAFEMTETEVTVQQYGVCVTAGSCMAPGTGGSCNWSASGYEDHPVNCVNWQQAVDFCTWAGGRLPSESEWEYAARSGGPSSSYTYPWGTATATCTYAVMWDGSSGCGTGRTWSVCSKTAGNTVQGLCDMAGNVWEWVEDDRHLDYTGAPTDGSAWVDSPRGSDRVVRGGSFGNVAYGLRAASRDGYDPSYPPGYLGFRCAR